MKKYYLLFIICMSFFLCLLVGCKDRDLDTGNITTSKAGGIGGAKLAPGVYVQESSYGSSGGVAQVGKTAYRLNADGTFDFTGYYEGAGSAWESHGTYTQSGNKITFVYQGNPMVPAGYTISAPIINSKSFGSPGDKFVKEG